MTQFLQLIHVQMHILYHYKQPLKTTRELAPTSNARSARMRRNRFRSDTRFDEITAHEHEYTHERNYYCC